MRVFVTGATGFIGSVIVQDLLGAGHQALGLARSDAAAKSLDDAGAQAHRGDLEDLESLRDGAAKCDGVIHTGFIHDFMRFEAVCEIDRRAIEALGSALAGSDRPFVITSGTGLGIAAPGRPASEDTFNPNHPNPRKASELAGVWLSERGVNVSVVRLPQVHNTTKQGLITPLVDLAKTKGVSAYVGEGFNRWPAVHVLDAARLYRLALEKGEPGSRYHAVAEEGVPLRDIAEVIGRGLKAPVAAITPEAAAEHFGWLAMFVGMDMPASSAITRERLGWRPAGPGLLADLEQMRHRET